VKDTSALALIETRSIARGMTTVDALVKKAPVVMRSAHPISPGHYLIIIAGGVAEVEESFDAAVRHAGEMLLDELFLPQVHEDVSRAIAGEFPEAGEDIDAMAILETHTVTASVLAADAACKAAEVQLVQMRLGQGLGGKGYFVLTGELHDVNAAVSAAREVVGGDAFLSLETIPRPHPEFVASCC